MLVFQIKEIKKKTNQSKREKNGVQKWHGKKDNERQKTNNTVCERSNEEI